MGEKVGITFELESSLPLFACFLVLPSLLSWTGCLQLFLWRGASTYLALHCLIIYVQLQTFLFCFRVMVFNSFPSTCVPVSNDVKLLEDEPGPVESLCLIPSNTSIAITWSPPSSGNGIISGYAIYIENVLVCSADYYSIIIITLWLSAHFLQVSNCAILNGSVRSYSIEGLRPFSEYTIDVKACTTAGDNYRFCWACLLILIIVTGEGSSEAMTISTLCGTPSGVQNLVIGGQTCHSLNVTWELPLQLNGDYSSIQYMVTFRV